MAEDITLAELYTRQVKQQRHWYPAKITKSEKQEVAKDLLLGLHEEVAELQRLLHHSYHILKGKSPERSNVTQEIVDIMKYTLAIAELEDITPSELTETFLAVSDTVDDRWRRERLSLSDQQVLVVDLDGCIADWWTGFTEWVRNLDDVDERLVDIDFVREHVNLPEMEKRKASFYSEGGFLHLPVFTDAAKVLKWCKTQGILVCILTARPRRRFKNVEVDTIQWCKKNDIEYDLLLFSRDKAEAICQHVMPAKVLAFVEDRPKHALEVAGLGVKVLRMVGPLAGEKGVLQPHTLIHEVDCWNAIYLYLENILTEEQRWNPT
jgi:hypothetical protein